MIQKVKSQWMPWVVLFMAAVLNFVQLELCNGNSMGMPLINVFINVGILLCIYGVVYAWSQRLWLTLTAINVVCSALAIANYYVIQFRGTPLSTRDIKNFATAMTVVESYAFEISKRIVASILIFVIIVALSIISKYVWEEKKRSGKQYCLRALSVTGVSLAFLYVTVFAPWSIKPKNTLGWSWELSYHEYGFLAESLEILESSWSTVTKPDSYSDGRREEWLASVKVEEVVTEELPNIIFILNESWYDLTTILDIETDVEITPHLDQTENAVRGYSLVPMTGTNLSEYEFLTGNSLQLMQGITPFNSLDMTGRESIVTVLEKLGYHTTAMHPAVNTNYSRNVAYPAMGFDTILFEDEFSEIELYGDRPHLTDSAAFCELIRQYEEHKENGPQFLYLLTIQNHGGWEVNDPALHTVKLKNDYSIYQIPPEEYLSCLQLTDKAWKELTDYFQTVEEPTIICMVGDHAPSFANILAKYWSEKTDDELAVLLNQTPFIIWANYDIDWPEVENTSINYFVPLVLQMAGIRTDAFYNYMSEMYQQIPVMSAFNMYVTSDGKQYKYSDDNVYSEWLEKYFVLEYGRVKR